jgi:hypothetical protein
MPEKAFLQHCEVCRKAMSKLLDRVNESFQLELAAEEGKKEGV